MSTVTAIMIVGTSHTYHGGIEPAFTLYLRENDKPSLMLVPDTLYQPPNELAPKPFVWIPTVENMVDDAMVMIAHYYLRNEKINEVINQEFKEDPKTRYFMMYDIDKEKRRILYDRSRSLKYNCKIIMTILKGSTLGNVKMLDRIRKYNVDKEICISADK